MLAEVSVICKYFGRIRKGIPHTMMGLNYLGLGQKNGLETVAAITYLKPGLGGLLGIFALYNLLFKWFIV